MRTVAVKWIVGYPAEAGARGGLQLGDTLPRMHLGWCVGLRSGKPVQILSEIGLALM